MYKSAGLRRSNSVLHIHTHKTRNKGERGQARFAAAASSAPGPTQIARVFFGSSEASTHVKLCLAINNYLILDQKFGISYSLGKLEEGGNVNK
jgi:hypothetical protein